MGRFRATERTARGNDSQRGRSTSDDDDVDPRAAEHAEKTHTHTTPRAASAWRGRGGVGDRRATQRGATRSGRRRTTTRARVIVVLTDTIIVIVIVARSSEAGRRRQRCEHAGQTRGGVSRGRQTSHRGRAGRRTRATDDGRSRGVCAHTPTTTTMGRDREAQSIAGESAAGDATSSFRWGGEAEALRTAPVVSAAVGGESSHVGSPAADFEARRWLLRFHQSGGSGGAAARPGDVGLRAPRPRTDHGRKWAVKG